MQDGELAEILKETETRSGTCLVAANDALRARMARLARENRRIPAELRDAADAVEAELLEAKFGNLPV